MILTDELKELYKKLGHEYRLGNLNNDEINLLKKYVLPMEFSRPGLRHYICSCGYSNQLRTCFICGEEISTKESYFMRFGKIKRDVFPSQLENNHYYYRDDVDTDVLYKKDDKYVVSFLSYEIKDDLFLNIKENFLEISMDEKKNKYQLFFNGKEYTFLELCRLFKELKINVNYLYRFILFVNHHKQSFNDFSKNDINSLVLQVLVYFHEGELDKELLTHLNQIIKKSKNRKRVNFHFEYLFLDNLIDLGKQDSVYTFEQVYGLTRKESNYFVNKYKINLYKERNLFTFVNTLSDENKKKLSLLIKDDFIKDMNERLIDTEHVANYLTRDYVHNVLFILLSDKVSLTMDDLVNYLNHINEIEALTVTRGLYLYKRYIEKTDTIKHIYPFNLKMLVNKLNKKN